MTDPVLPPPLQAPVDAINNADTEAFVAAFTDDGYVDEWGRVLRGGEGVRRWAESDAIPREPLSRCRDFRTRGVRGRRSRARIAR